jgi:hypothetical protein
VLVVLSGSKSILVQKSVESTDQFTRDLSIVVHGIYVFKVRSC